MMTVPFLWLMVSACVKHDTSSTMPPGDGITVSLPDDTTDTVPPTDTDTGTAGADNVLVVVLDDIGIDKVKAYHPAEAANMPSQPTLESLSENGVRFVHTWAQPTCSPARAAMITGRYPRRHGIGGYIPLETDLELPLSEITLAEVLHDAGYHTGAFGKWHLSTLSSPTGAAHPNEQGFDRYQGWLGNFGGGRTFFEYPYIQDGVILEDFEEAYATTQTMDDALAWIAEQEQANAPWFAWVATHAVHAPLHEPPRYLHSYTIDASSPDSEIYAAMVEATDTELARLLAGVDLRTTHVIVLGDNGTLGSVMVPPFDPERDKGTLYEGGVRVPMWVLGPSVSDPGGERNQMFHVVDLMPTVLSILGLTAPDELDGVDQAAVWTDPGARPVREHMFADEFKPLGPGPYTQLDDRVVRTQDHKLVQNALTGDLALYRVPAEHVDEGERLLPDELPPKDEAALQLLMVLMDQYGQDVVYGPRAP